MNSIGTGVVNGAGYTNQNTPEEYAKNIVKSTMTNAIGTATGNRLFGSGNDMYRAGRGIMSGSAQSMPYGYEYFNEKNYDE